MPGAGNLVRCGVVVALLILQVVGCGGGGSDGDNPAIAPDGDWPDDQATFDVEWDPKTTVIEQKDLIVLKSADPENDTYTFDAAAVRRTGLDLSPGRILVIYQTALVEIVHAREDGGDLVVTTGPAALTDAIENGTIAWDVGVSFTSDKIRVIDTNAASKRIMAKDANVMEHSFAYGGYDYDLKITLRDTQAIVEFTTKKELANGVGAKFTTTGTIQRFRCTDSITITNNTLKTFDHRYEKLSGNLTLTLAAAASGNDLRHQITRPLFAFPIPMPPTCPIKLELEVGAVFVINAVVPASGSAEVTASFSYDSDIGVRFDGAKATGQADFENVNVKDQGADHHVAGASQVGVNYGIGFPHIELKGNFIHEQLASAAAWAHPAYLIGGSFTVGQPLVPSCVKVDAEFIGAAGISVSALAGFFSADKEFDLFRQKKNLLTAGQCPEE